MWRGVVGDELSKRVPCSICGQRRPTELTTGVLFRGLPVAKCPKCGHIEVGEYGQDGPIWELLFFSLPLQKQAALLGVPEKEVPPLPWRLNKPLVMPRSS